MKNRCINLLLMLVCLLVLTTNTKLALASVPRVAAQYATADNNLGDDWFPNLQGVCDNFKSKWNAQHGSYSIILSLNASEATYMPYACVGQAQLQAPRDDGTPWPPEDTIVGVHKFAPCPANSENNESNTAGSCTCKVGYTEAGKQCVPAKPENMCSAGLSAGNPILPATGEKYRNEKDWSDTGPHGLSVERVYRSGWASDPTHLTGSLGKIWSHNYETALKLSSDNTAEIIEISFPEGYKRSFMKDSGFTSWVPLDNSDSLVSISSGGWIYKNQDDEKSYAFASNGNLLSQTDRNGWAVTLSYNAFGKIATVRNAFSTSIGFSYDSANRLVSILLPGNKTIAYGYDDKERLSSVTYPDNTTRTFLYENQSFQHALTGILDETGTRWGSFNYDSNGYAVYTSLAGDAEFYGVYDYGNGRKGVQDPLGTLRMHTYRSSFGKMTVSTTSLPSPNGERTSAQRVIDSNGLVVSETDFKGIQTSKTWDVARRLPLTITRAVGTAEQQIVAIQWHPNFRLPIEISEAGRRVRYTYDAVGRALSKEVSHTGTNQSKVEVTNWTYNAQGLVATQIEPNGAQTAYSYDSKGNKTSQTNALGHTTHYVYDSSNRLVQLVMPNGLQTSYVWDQRDRLLTKTVGGQQTTSLTYSVTGTLVSVALPSGLVYSYTYDLAHRNIGWSNNRGESGVYTLDRMGNRVEEKTFDSANNLAWKLTRSINELNRVASETRGDNQTVRYEYDANGDRISESDAINQKTRYTRDSLGRVSNISKANGSASVAWNGIDAITSISDFAGAVTTFQRDANGMAIKESSVDSGNRSGQYDHMGMPTQIVDALGQATQIQRDAIGRPTRITFNDGKSTLLKYDLQGTEYNGANSNSSVGFLSEIQDRSGVTSYKRDEFGRVIAKKQIFTNGLTGSIAYGYNAAGLKILMVNPLGFPTEYFYDGTGQLNQINFRGVPQITNISWNPLGQPTSWTWAFSNDFYGLTSSNVNTSRTYDTAGRMTQGFLRNQLSLAYNYDAVGRVNSIMQLVARPDSPQSPGSTVTLAPENWSVSYDIGGRILRFDSSVSTSIFNYDGNGNRTSSSSTVNGLTNFKNYSVQYGQNLLQGFHQVQGDVSTAVGYSYDANGDLLSDGLRTFSYNAEGRLNSVTTGLNDASPTTRYAYNALGQRVFKTEPIYPPAEGDEADQGFFASLIAFFAKLWTPAVSPAEVLGYAYAYDEEGNLIGEMGLGGPNSSGQAFYLWMPSSNGAIPVMMMTTTSRYAIMTDHLNTPRAAVNWDGSLAWQWEYSAFGDVAPTIASNSFRSISPDMGDFTLNLRYPGQYFDVESGLNYNYFRSYSPSNGRYTQSDPIGLSGGWNRFGYAEANPLLYTDPRGLNPLTMGVAGASIGSVFGPVGTAVGGAVGAGTGALIGWNLIGPMFQKDGSESKPDNCPSGTLPIDRAKKPFGLDKDDVHDIKDGVEAGPRTWTGIDPDGNVWTGGRNGMGENHGPYTDYLPGSKR